MLQTPETYPLLSNVRLCATIFTSIHFHTTLSFTHLVCSSPTSGCLGRTLILCLYLRIFARHSLSLPDTPETLLSAARSLEMCCDISMAGRSRWMQCLMPCCKGPLRHDTRYCTRPTTNESLPSPTNGAAHTISFY